MNRVIAPVRNGASSPRAADWRDRAACTNADPDLFFPEKNTPAATVREAKRICASCPVRQACLEEAIRSGEPDAICGGLTAAERAGKLGAPRVRRAGRATARQLAVKHGAYLLVALVEWRMSVEEVAESLGSTPLAVHRAYLILVPARLGQRRSKKPSQIEELLATSKERMKTLQRLGRSHEQIGEFLGMSQSVVSAALAVLRQREEAVRRLSESGPDALARLQDEELRIRRESGFGLTVQEVIEAEGRSILRMHGGGMPLRKVALELRLCRETVRRAYQEMTKARFENTLTQNEMGEAA